MGPRDEPFKPDRQPILASICSHTDGIRLTIHVQYTGLPMRIVHALLFVFVLLCTALFTYTFQCFSLELGQITTNDIAGTFG